MAGETGLLKQLNDQIKGRALVYLAVYDTLEAEFGAAKAEELLKRAIYRRGTAVGKPLQGFAPRDLAGLKTAFLAIVPGEGALFKPEVTRSDAQALDIKFHACPLQEAWREAGVGEAKLETLCRIAGVVDNGTFESAGFGFSADTWKPGRSGCCFLHIRPGA